jgi:hypothetical protein
MANENPKGARRAVPHDLSAQHVAILRGHFAACLEGAEGDLETPERLRNPDKLRSDADAYKRLLAALKRGDVLIPDEAARVAVKEMAVAADEATDYAAVVAEHDALHGLLALLERKSG